jgi:hypothetical protein
VTGANLRCRVSAASSCRGPRPSPCSHSRGQCMPAVGTGGHSLHGIPLDRGCFFLPLPGFRGARRLVLIGAVYQESDETSCTGALSPHGKSRGEPPTPSACTSPSAIPIRDGELLRGSCASPLSICEGTPMRARFSALPVAGAGAFSFLSGERHFCNLTLWLRSSDSMRCRPCGRRCELVSSTMSPSESLCFQSQFRCPSPLRRRWLPPKTKDA